MREENGKKAVSAGIWYMVCNLVLKGLSIFTAPFFNRVLTKGEVGAFSNVLAWAGILLILTTWELYSSVSNAKIDFKNSDFDEYMSTNLILGSFITGICFIVLLIFRDFICELTGISFNILLLLSLNFFASSATSLSLARYRVFLQYKQTIILTFFMTISTLGTSIILVLVMEDNFMARIIGSYAPTIVIGIVAYVLILRKSICFKSKYCKYILGISVPLVFHLLAGTILNSSDRIIINDICGNEDTALYSVAYMIVSIVQILWSSASSAWVPWCYDRFMEGRYEDVNKSAKIILTSYFILIGLIMLVAPEALLILGGSSYIEAMWVVPPILMGCLVTAVYTLYVNVEQFYKKTIFVAIGTLIAAVSNVILNSVFVPKYGYIVAAYTTLVSFLLLFVFHFLITRYVIKKAGILNNQFVFKYLIAVGAMLPIILLLYRLWIARLSVIVILVIATGIIIYKHRIEIKKILSFKSKQETICDQ